MDSWMAKRGTKTVGPLSMKVLQDKATSGRLLPSDLVKLVNQDEWRPAANIRGLFPNIPSKPTSENVGVEGVMPKMTPANPGPPPFTPSIEKAEGQKLGGWLFLVALGLVAGPFLKLFALYPLVQIFSTEAWSNLTTPSSEVYHVLWAPLIIFESIVNPLLIAGNIYLLVLFFMKKKDFPKFYICYLALSAGIVTLDTILIASINTSFVNSDVLRNTFQAIIGCAIWIPYMIKSDRVAHTFIH